MNNDEQKQELKAISTILEELLKQFNKLNETIENSTTSTCDFNHLYINNKTTETLENITKSQTDSNRYLKNKQLKKGN